MKIPLRPFSLGVLALVGLIACASQANAQNLLTNGSFEQPGDSSNPGDGRQSYPAGSTDITGWTVEGPSGDVFLHKTPDVGDLAGPNFNYAQDGNFYLDLSGDTNSHPSVFQDFATVPLTSYQLTFYIGSASTAVGPTINVQLMGLTSLLNTTLTPLAPGTNINWLSETFSFVANSTTTRLSFLDLSNSDDNASFIDTVTVVPEPSTWTLLVVGALGVGVMAMRRRARA